MKLLVLQHVPFEGPAAIASWARRRGHSIDHLCCAGKPQYPSQDQFDLLIIMGGPMSVNDPLDWLSAEIEFIRQAIESRKIVLGVCLGAQMIACALGASVQRHNQREIGWFPVTQTESASAITSALPATFAPLHWHGDTFAIPEGAIQLYRSEACENQAYLYKNRVLGLQFHLEFDEATTRRVADACTGELAEGGKYVQSEQEILADPQRFKTANQLMFVLLDALTSAKSLTSQRK